MVRREESAGLYAVWILNCQKQSLTVNWELGCKAVYHKDMQPFCRQKTN